MGYHLVAVIGGSDLLGRVTRAATVSLTQGLSLLPMTDEFRDEVGDGSPVVPAGFEFMPGGFDRTLMSWSAGGPVAYVEAEYFGGVGTQCAAVWHGGTLVYGPCAEPPLPRTRDEPLGRRTASTRSPISAALHRLGVVRGEHDDEFAAVGLGRHRDLDDWLDSATGLHDQ
ncbi:hypothetical protein [Micromonospora sp. NBC_01796]|uniref:hypothetical protein n=1 Tax=Micromonospora sp. NBC_01796 TaxID=2975987 RepID=UPI002DD7D3E9|nr:hypothetical protein [Micromonospora sp. NBC_01796]WSA83257.1 hypothetical protein OIE47_22935 [Micromonospora sp. NBC_01796]